MRTGTWSHEVGRAVAAGLAAAACAWQDGRSWRLVVGTGVAAAVLYLAGVRRKTPTRRRKTDE